MFPLEVTLIILNVLIHSRRLRDLLHYNGVTTFNSKEVCLQSEWWTSVRCSVYVNSNDPVRWPFLERIGYTLVTCPSVALPKCCSELMSDKNLPMHVISALFRSPRLMYCRNVLI